MVIRVALVLALVTAGVFGVYIPGIAPLRVETPTGVPDFRDRSVWTPLKDGTFINLEDGVPWSISYLYVRFDDSATGKETAFLWDIDTPVHKIWGRPEKEQYQSLLQKSGWTPPIKGDKMEPILRVDWSVGGKAVGATLLVYDGDSHRPFAWETFHHPLEAEEKVLSSASQKF